MSILGYPSKILFGPDGKADFPTSAVMGIPRLYTERHISAADHRYWAQFTTKFDTVDDVYASLQVAELRKAAEEAPENLVTLVDVLTLHLESLVNDPHFAPVPKASPGGWSALLASTAPTPPVDGRDRHREALNCCRVLSRVIPILYESKPRTKEDIDITDLEHSALWHTKPRPSGSSRTPTQGPGSRVTPHNQSASTKTPEQGRTDDDDQFILADGDESIMDPLTEAAGDVSTVPVETVSCTGHVLLMTLMELLFYAGFTMPWAEEQFASDRADVSRVHFTIWEAGIGSPVDLSHTTMEHLQRRTEVLRLLLVLLAKPMYVEATALPTSEMQALRFITTELDRPVVLSFLCSLLNTVSNYRQSDAWFTFGTDLARERYLSMCLQTLGAVLTYEDTSNLFSFYAKKLYRESDFVFLLHGALKAFQAAMSVSHGAFEMGHTQATFPKPAEEHVSEWLAVLWHLLRTNDKLMPYVAASPIWSMHVMSWALYVALANRNHAATLGQAQCAIFLLQDLSAQPAFAEHLTQPASMNQVTVSVRLLRRHSTLALDALIESAYFLITTSAGPLRTLYPNMLYILYNTAPQWKHVCVVSASRIEQLVRQFAAPKYLLCMPEHPSLLNLLLQTLSRVMLYHYADNVHVAYVIVRLSSVLEQVRTLRLDEALEAIHRRWEHAKVWHKDDLSTTKSLPSPPAGTETTANEDVLTPSTDMDVAFRGAEIQNEQSLAHGADPLAVDEVLGTASSEVKVDAKTADTDAQDDGKEEAEAEPKEDTKANADDVIKEDTDADVKEDTERDAKATEVDHDAMREPAQEGGSTTRTGLSAPELRRVAVSIGKHGFVPTQAWVDAWQPTLSLDVLTPMLAYLTPRLQSFTQSDAVVGSANAHEQILQFLQTQSLDEVLPGASAPTMQPFVWSAQSTIWFQSYFWGLVYAVGATPWALWLDTHTHLFEVHTETPRDSTAAMAMGLVSSWTAGLLPTWPFTPLTSNDHGQATA